jgi:hypothetical protein
MISPAVGAERSGIGQARSVLNANNEPCCSSHLASFLILIAVCHPVSWSVRASHHAPSDAYRQFCYVGLNTCRPYPDHLGPAAWPVGCAIERRCRPSASMALRPVDLVRLRLVRPVTSAYPPGTRLGVSPSGVEAPGLGDGRRLISGLPDNEIVGSLARLADMVDHSTIEVPVTGGVAVVPKRLVVCCDGTWNTADQAISGHPSPTNVTKLALALAAEDAAGARQCVYYHPGVGTSRWERLSGGAFGVGLSRNVLDGYRFLIDNYESGDLLYLFGFSRGAFTARSLAGLIRNSGILRRENVDRIDQAWALYRSSADTPRGVAATLFRRAYSFEPRIQFIGVWDTVGALGIPTFGPRWLKPIVSRINHRWEFHDTKLSTRVKGAFQALAIDEQRAAFAPAVWHQQPGADGQKLRQVWFTGVHCDIGGGYPETSLSDIALLWMADRTRPAGITPLVPAYWSGSWRDIDPGCEHYFPPVRVLVGDTAVSLPVVDLGDRAGTRGGEPGLHPLAGCSIRQVEHKLVQPAARVRCCPARTISR